MTTQITLPRDAEGREIPLDTAVLYDANGDKREVQAFEFSVIDGMWRVQFLGNFIFFYTNDMRLTPPDSWEKLLEDLDNASKGGDNAECCYARMESVEVGSRCYGCSLFKNDDVSPECSYLAYADIAARIRKLRGDCE